MRKEEFGETRYEILNLVATKEKIAIKDIVKAFEGRLSQPAVQKHVTDSIKNALIETGADRTDRRVNFLHLTEKGRSLLEKKKTGDLRLKLGLAGDCLFIARELAYYPLIKKGELKKKLLEKKPSLTHEIIDECLKRLINNRFVMNKKEGISLSYFMGVVYSEHDFFQEIVNGQLEVVSQYLKSDVPREIYAFLKTKTTRERLIRVFLNIHVWYFEVLASKKKGVDDLLKDSSLFKEVEEEIHNKVMQEGLAVMLAHGIFNIPGFKQGLLKLGLRKS